MCYFCCDFVTNFQKKTMNFWKGGRGSFTIQNLFAEFLDFPKKCNRVFRNKAGEGGCKAGGRGQEGVEGGGRGWKGAIGMPSDGAARIV